MPGVLFMRNPPPSVPCYTHPDGGVYIIEGSQEGKCEVTGDWIPGVAYRDVRTSKLYWTSSKRWAERFTLSEHVYNILPARGDGDMSTGKQFAPDSIGESAAFSAYAVLRCFNLIGAGSWAIPARIGMLTQEMHDNSDR